MQGSKTASSFQRPEERATSARRRTGRGIVAVLLLGCAHMAAAQTAPQPARRATMDSNGDGVLDARELRAATQATFKRADADGDGCLTADELSAARMAGDAERRTRGLGALLGARGRGAETAAERFERLDADRDGRISEEELVDAPHPLLRFDADGDGSVTREEIEQAQRSVPRGVL